jgi:hypothetical protein
MGRPIKKAFIGNTSTAGQQLVGYAWTAGDSGPRPGYVVQQKGTGVFVMSSIDGSGVQGGGLVELVNGALTTAGQGNITVTPYGTDTVSYARKITDRIVHTWDDKQYEWLFSGQTLPGYGWATLSSQ